MISTKILKRTLFSQNQVLNTYNNSVLILALIHYVFLYSNITGSLQH